MKESIFKTQRFITQHISILMIKPYPHFMCADYSIYTFCDCWNGLKARESVRFFFFTAQEHRNIRIIQMLICTWCVFTTSTWQVIERVHVVYGSWFSWRYASLLHFGIGGSQDFPKGCRHQDFKALSETGYNSVLLNIIYRKYEVKMTRILFQFMIYLSCERALKNGRVKSQIEIVFELHFWSEQLSYIGLC